MGNSDGCSIKRNSRCTHEAVILRLFAVLHFCKGFKKRVKQIENCRLCKNNFCCSYIEMIRLILFILFTCYEISNIIEHFFWDNLFLVHQDFWPFFGTCFPRGFQTCFGEDFAWFLVDFLVTFLNNFDDWSASEKHRLLVLSQTRN